jgi:hypothetical protein
MWHRWQLHCICAHGPHVSIGFMDLPHALHAHNQGACLFPLHYHNVDTVSVSFTVQDLHAITIPFTLISLSHLIVLLEVFALALLKEALMCAMNHYPSCS